MAVVVGVIAARKAAGLSQATLAARIGSTQSAVARLEAGRASPRLETLRRIARATGHRLWVEFLPEELGGHDRTG
jgi:transcriptional regulator with XRE-family HTH domain